MVRVIPFLRLIKIELYIIFWLSLSWLLFERSMSTSSNHTSRLTALTHAQLQFDYYKTWWLQIIINLPIWLLLRRTLYIWYSLDLGQESDWFWNDLDYWEIERRAVSSTIKNKIVSWLSRSSECDFLFAARYLLLRVLHTVVLHGRCCTAGYTAAVCTIQNSSSCSLFVLYSNSFAIIKLSINNSVSSWLDPQDTYIIIILLFA